MKPINDMSECPDMSILYLFNTYTAQNPPYSYLTKPLVLRIILAAPLLHWAIKNNSQLLFRFIVSYGFIIHYSFHSVNPLFWLFFHIK